MLSTTLFAIPSAGSSSQEHQRLHPFSGDTFPDIAVLPETLLAMELQRHNLSFDLSGVTRVILRDPGATLQILRLAGKEYGNGVDRPTRIADCISDLGLKACLAVIERGTLTPVADPEGIRVLWENSRAVARVAAVAAERMPEGIEAGQAYLGGLLHALDRVPALHGWPCSQTLAGPHLALLLADLWCLPDFLRDMFCEAAAPGFDSRWARLMDKAARLAGIPSQVSQMDTPIRMQAAAI